jgi:hypothetical protein
MKSLGSSWIVLVGLTACSRARETATPGVEDEREVAATTAAGRTTLEILPGPINHRTEHVQDLSAEELVALRDRRAADLEGLTEEERAVLAEYDGVLASIARWDEAPVPDALATQPFLVTRDYELWVLPGSGKECYTVTDRTGKALAERVGEERLRQDFSYLHSLLHPEYKQFYDVVDD